MRKQKKHGALFYVLAVIFYPITLTVLIVRLCVRQKEKSPSTGKGSRRELFEIIGGQGNAHTLATMGLKEKDVLWYVKNYLQISGATVPDCLHKLDTTRTPAIFFDALKNAEYYLYGNCVVYAHYPREFAAAPADDLQRFTANKSAYTRAFVDRYREATRRKYEKFATTAEKVNLLEASRATVEQYAQLMTAADLTYFRAAFDELAKTV